MEMDLRKHENPLGTYLILNLCTQKKLSHYQFLK